MLKHKHSKSVFFDFLKALRLTNTAGLISFFNQLLALSVELHTVLIADSCGGRAMWIMELHTAFTYVYHVIPAIIRYRAVIPDTAESITRICLFSAEYKVLSVRGADHRAVKICTENLYVRIAQAA